MSRRIGLRSAALVAAALFAAACARTEQADQPAMAQPDTTASALWTHLEAADYRSWPMWPGKAQLYAGTEPHGMLLTTYVNGAALAAITGGAPALPAGAVVVKENYMPDSTLAAVTVMFKSPGYAPGQGDWYWMKRLADGTVEAEGRVQMCQTCHGAQAGNDFLYTGQLGSR